MNQTAIEYFAKDWDNPQDEFNHGLSLFISASGSRNLIRSYNTKGYTEQNLEKLKYDLKKHTGITDQDIEEYRSTLADDVNDSPRNMEETITENKDRFAVLLGALPDDVQKGMKLYGTYPFLRTKDCPDEYKVLVADAITAFEEYKAGHKELFEKVASVTEPMLTDEEIYQVASAVLENFDLNREIHEELQHYADKGEILGKHPIFEWYMKEKKIAEMSAADLSKGFNNFKSYVSKSKTSLEKAETDEEKKEWEDHIANLEREKALYKKYLDGKK